MRFKQKILLRTVNLVIINGTVPDFALKVRQARIAKSEIILIGKQLNPDGDRRSYLYSAQS